MLTDKLNAALASSSGTAQNFYLTRLRDALNAVEQAAANSQQLQEYAKQLDKLPSFDGPLPDRSTLLFFRSPAHETFNMVQRVECRPRDSNASVL